MSRELLFYLCLINSSLFLYVIVIQFIKVISSPPNDKDIGIKTAVLVKSLCLLIAMWLGFLKVPGTTLLYFLVVSIILIYKNKWTEND
jgi:hypothetical protein